MTTFASPASVFSVEESAGIRSIDGLRSVYLTRLNDNASILVHELGADQHEVFRGLAPDVPLPDFAQPFITRIYGPVTWFGRHFLLEPVPLCVPLLDTWQSVLQERPHEIPSVLRALTGQVAFAVRCAHKEGQQHGAICIANVILTTAGVYGLLQARIGSCDGLSCVRPIEDGAGVSAVQDLDDELAIETMKNRLIAIARGNWKVQQSAIDLGLRTHL